MPDRHIALESMLPEHNTHSTYRTPRLNLRAIGIRAHNPPGCKEIDGFRRSIRQRPIWCMWATRVADLGPRRTLLLACNGRLLPQGADFFENACPALFL